MTDFQAYSKHHIVSGTDDWNQLLDHGLEKPAAFIIRKKTDGTVQAINCSTGKVDYSGADAETVINEAIQALPSSGGRIVVKAGDYVVTDDIFIDKDNVEFFGEGEGTRFIAGWNGSPESNADGVVTVDHAKYCKVGHFSVDGKREDYQYTIGVLLNEAYYCSVVETHLYHTSLAAICLYGSSRNLIAHNFFGDWEYYTSKNAMWMGGNSSYNRVIGNTALKCRCCGFEVDAGGAWNTFTANVVFYCGEDSGEWGGFKIYGGEFNAYVGNTVADCYKAGFWIENTVGGVGRSVITGNVIYHCGWDGIRIFKAPNMVVTSNHIQDCGYQQDNTYDGVRLTDDEQAYTHHCLVSSNLIYNTGSTGMRYGVSENGASDDYNLIHGNSISAMKTAAISKQGTNSVSADNLEN